MRTLCVCDVNHITVSRVSRGMCELPRRAVSDDNRVRIGDVDTWRVSRRRVCDHRSRPPAGGRDRPESDDAGKEGDFRSHRPARRHRLGDHRLRPRRIGQRGVVRHRGAVHLRRGISLLRAADRDEGGATTRRRRDARRGVRQRPRLHADRPPRAVRPPLRGDRRRRPTCRAGARRADGLPAWNDLDHHRRCGRRLRAGLPGARHLDAPQRAQPRPDGP